MADIQYQKNLIDEEARGKKDQIDREAATKRQAAVDLESERIRQEAEKNVQQVQNDVQN